MARVKRGNIARKRRNKILNLAKGFRGGNKNVMGGPQDGTWPSRAAVHRGQDGYPERLVPVC